jgi:hypothetical protein
VISEPDQLTNACAGRREENVEMCDLSTMHGLTIMHFCVALRQGVKVCQACHNLNHTAKQPVVMSPAVQFHPVLLMKKMLVTVGQVNRLNSQ